MAIMRRRSSGEPMSIRSEMERMFDEMEEWPRRFFTPWTSMLPRRRLLESVMPAPTVDVIDKKNSIIVKADMPGVEKEDIDISVTEDTLTIKGESKKEEETKDEDYYCCERSYGGFSRTIALPTKVKTDKVKANLKNGILEIELPKTKIEKTKEVEIEVK